MHKCNICGGTKNLAAQDQIVLCRRCLRVIYQVMLPKIRHIKQESRKNPNPR